MGYRIDYPIGGKPTVVWSPNLSESGEITSLNQEINSLYSQNKHLNNQIYSLHNKMEEQGYRFAKQLQELEYQRMLDNLGNEFARMSDLELMELMGKVRANPSSCYKNFTEHAYLPEHQINSEVFIQQLLRIEGIYQQLTGRRLIDDFGAQLSMIRERMLNFSDGEYYFANFDRYITDIPLLNEKMDSIKTSKSLLVQGKNAEMTKLVEQYPTYKLHFRGEQQSPIMKEISVIPIIVFMFLEIFGITNVFEFSWIFGDLALLGAYFIIRDENLSKGLGDSIIGFFVFLGLLLFIPITNAGFFFVISYLLAGILFKLTYMTDKMKMDLISSRFTLKAYPHLKVLHDSILKDEELARIHEALNNHSVKIYQIYARSIGFFDEQKRIADHLEIGLFSVSYDKIADLAVKQVYNIDIDDLIKISKTSMLEKDYIYQL